MAQHETTCNNKYQHGKVYEIVSNLTEKVYIGSTTSRLSLRMAQHRLAYRKRAAGQPYNARTSAYEILVIDPKAEIYLIENFPCQDRDELRSRERHWVEVYSDICVNINWPIVSHEERLESQREYYQRNRESVIEKNLTRYYAKKAELAEYVTCECGRAVTRGGLHSHTLTHLHRQLLEDKKNSIQGSETAAENIIPM